MNGRRQAAAAMLPYLMQQQQNQQAQQQQIYQQQIDNINRNRAVTTNCTTIYNQINCKTR